MNYIKKVAAVVLILILGYFITNTKKGISNIKTNMSDRMHQAEKILDDMN